ncbi:hypothetical protein EC588_10080 [Klebsiella quasipneumoniae subsp. similipneumoniae]|nr:hypothetical protein EC588_10080 [Klebsiella quasipneumoniae subsp. similipneumoniae]
MLSKTGFTHSDLLCWQSDYAGGSLNVNGTIMRDTYIAIKDAKSLHMRYIKSYYIGCVLV